MVQHGVDAHPRYELLKLVVDFFHAVDAAPGVGVILSWGTVQRNSSSLYTTVRGAPFSSALASLPLPSKRRIPKRRSLAVILALPLMALPAMAFSAPAGASSCRAGGGRIRARAEGLPSPAWPPAGSAPPEVARCPFVPGTGCSDSVPYAFSCGHMLSRGRQCTPSL